METPKERQQKEKEKADFLHSLELRECYRMTFETEHGRRVLEDFIERGHMLETTCSGNAWSYFYEGERNWILRITSMIPDLIGRVMSEIMAKRQGDINRQIADLARGEEE